MLRGVDCYMFQVHSLRDLGTREVVNVSPYQANADDTLEQTLTRVIRVESDCVFVDPVINAEITKTLFAMQDKITLLSEMPAKDCAVPRSCNWCNGSAMPASWRMA